jgi:hypothetical protein
LNRFQAFKQLILFILENRVLRRIFGPKRDEVTRGWRKLHNEEPHDLYSSPSLIRMIKSRRMRWTRHVARMGEKKIVYRILVGKPEANRPLSRVKRTSKNNIKMDSREMGWAGTCSTSIDLVQDMDQWRDLVNAVMNLPLP